MQAQQYIHEHNLFYSFSLENNITKTNFWQLHVDPELHGHSVKEPLVQEQEPDDSHHPE